MSEAEIAEITGITYPTLNRIGRGITSTPNQNTIKKLEVGLRIKIDDSNPNEISYTKMTEPDNKIESAQLTSAEKEMLSILKEEGYDPAKLRRDIMSIKNIKNLMVGVEERKELVK